MAEQRSEFIELEGERLHVRHIVAAGDAVICFHGSIANGRIFYTESGKGFAPYLAEHGYDAYVADFRGHGGSIPPLSRHSRYGQTELITREIPAVVEGVRSRRGDAPIFLVGQSWAGVLLLSYLARFPEEARKVKGIILFATKRSISVWNLTRLFQIELVWKALGPVLNGAFGYLALGTIGLAPENETAAYQRDVTRWIRQKPWVDPSDGFDYGRAIRAVELPPVLWLAGGRDAALGHPEDVLRFRREVGEHESEYWLLSRGAGHLHDYDHRSILIHPEAPKDHFPAIVKWMEELRSGRRSS